MKISARYEVLGLLGQGGMGVVYHVRDTTRGRENALKTLAPGRSDDIVERFLTEAQVMFRLEHSNIVRVFDFGKDGETYFLTMELIRGKNLRQLLNARQNKGFSLAEVIRMGVETADALNYAHSQKPEAVVHRDIKPVNIMVEEETGRVVVTDFGIAKLMADTGGETQAASDLSRTVFAGTVPYSAPEQFQPIGSNRRLDARVDIYALGMVLYEIYTGRHFFAGLSADEVELHHRSLEGGECPVRSVHACDHKAVLPDTPEAFVRVIDKAIARDRNERYKTAADMLADLQACAASASVEACAAARQAAEEAGAGDASPTEFRRAGDLEQEAQAARQSGDHAKAGELFRGAMQAFSAAAAQAGERRAQRGAQEAKTAMQIVAREATDRDTGTLAPNEMRQAAQLIAAGEASEAQGQFEQAAAQYREAEEAFRAAMAAARLASARREIEAEMPAVRAAREAAEQADAATLAADAFEAAVREQLQMEEALAAGELTRVRELLPRIREGFANAGAEAERRLGQSVEEARAAMRAVAAEATAAGAPTHAKAQLIEAETLAGAAEKLVERGELEIAVGQLGRAAAAYRTAVTAAQRAGERALLERELPALRAARSAAEQAGAEDLAADAFAAAAREQAALEEALAAGELTRVRTLLPKVGEGFAAAKASAVVAQASRAAVDARTAMASARDAALAAGAEQYAPDALGKVRAREKEGAAAEERQQWERAEQIYGAAAKAYEDVRAAALKRAEEQRLATARAEARTAAEEARGRAKRVNAPKLAAEAYGEAGALVKKAEAAANDAAGMAAAAADYGRAAERFDAATAEAERAARRNELEETLAAVEEARKQAFDAGAGRNPEFAAAADELAAAQRALAADELSLVVSSASTARDRFAAAKAAVEQAQAEAAADAALADVAAQYTEAREAGAEQLAPTTWAKAIEQQKQALARRHDGECAAVLALATAAVEGFTAALGEAARAAESSATAARKAAELAGPDDTATGAADRSFSTAEQRRGEGKLVAAAIAFRKATEGYASAVAARTEGARKAESEAKTARQEAESAEAARLAADDHKAALAHFEDAAKALAAGRFSAAETAYGDAARRFRAAAATAAHERKRAASLAARAAAETARERATKAGAAELAASELKRAGEAFTAGERALETENFAGSEADFTKAADGFERAHDAAVQAALQREAEAARTNVDRLRATRAPAATGFFARRKLAKADAVLARATAAAAGGDFAAAKAAFAEAAQLFEAMPAAAPPPPAPTAPPAAKPATPAKAAAKAGKAAARGPLPVESTTILEGATAIERAPVLDTATVVAGASASDVTSAAARDVTSAASLEGATVVAERTAVDSPTLVGRPVPGAAPARGLPVAWIGAGVGGVLLLAGIWMARDLMSGGATAPGPEPPKVARKVDEPKKQDVAPPIAQEPAPPAATAVQIAKVEPTAAPVIPKPRIASLAPEGATVEASGERQQFQIALADATDATYVWSVDGKVLSAETKPALTVAPGQKTQRVAVTARTAGGEIGHEWELAALAPPPAPKVAAGPPVVSGFTPSDTTLQIAPGKRTRFSVKAKYEGTEPVRYAWSIDGKTAGSAAAVFDFTPDDDDEGAVRKIRAEISTGTGQSVRQEWTVTVPPAPVVIARQSPATNEIVADLGKETDFSVEARAGRSGTSQLSYVWTVNKRPAAADGPRFSYQPDRAGNTDIEVRVEAPDRQPATRRWTVKAKDQAPVAEPTRIAALPPRVEPTPVPRVAGDARRELEAWIASYRDAYQQKNVDRLVALGVVTPENRGKLKNALDDLAGLKVEIAGPSIEIQSPDSAVVSFTRQDSFDAGGRPQTKSINIKKTVRKVGGNWVAQ